MTSLYKDFYGDQTRWFIGTVTDISDPLELGRVKVRVDGVHDDTTLIPASSLPWAQCLVSITQGGTNGLGNNLGIQVNARVFGFFLDGTNSQMPIIFGSMPKFEEASPGGKTTNQLATGTNTLAERKVTAGTNPDTITEEPESPYAAEYPNNKPMETTSGHVIEIDDTPGAERIHIYHKSGTFVEMHPEGDVVTHHKNGFRTVTGNDKLHVTGDLNIVADGDITIDGKTINLNSGTNGAARLNDTTLDNDTEINGNDIGVITSSSQTVFIGG